MVSVRYSHQRRKFCFCKLFAMGTNESFDHSLSTYSQLLDSASQDMEHSFMYSAFHSSSPKPPTMLCFGNVNNNNTSISIDNNKKKLEEELGFVERGNKVIQKSGITGGSTDSSSASSSNNISCSNSFTKSKRGQIATTSLTIWQGSELSLFTKAAIIWSFAVSTTSHIFDSLFFSGHQQLPWETSTT